MNNSIFINNLDNLSKDRFALNHLDGANFYQFYGDFLSQFGIIPTNSSQDWYLIGTDGCHLCDNINTLLAQISSSNTLPNYHTLDITHANDAEILINHIGTMIPLLLTPTRLLCYPFGVMDIISLTHSTKR